jgi:hypothetical protein
VSPQDYALRDTKYHITAFVELFPYPNLQDRRVISKELPNGFLRQTPQPRNLGHCVMFFKCGHDYPPRVNTVKSAKTRESDRDNTSDKGGQALVDLHLSFIAVAEFAQRFLGGQERW